MRAHSRGGESRRDIWRDSRRDSRGLAIVPQVCHTPPALRFGSPSTRRQYSHQARLPSKQTTHKNTTSHNGSCCLQHRHDPLAGLPAELPQHAPPAPLPLPAPGKPGLWVPQGL